MWMRIIHFLRTQNILKKLTFLAPWYTHVLGLRKVCFSESFAHLLNEWFHARIKKSHSNPVPLPLVHGSGKYCANPILTIFRIWITAGNIPLLMMMMMMMMMMTMMMMMMMMMMNCFSGMFDRWKTLRFICSRDHCQRFSSSQIWHPKQDLNLHKTWIKVLLIEFLQ